MGSRAKLALLALLVFVAGQPERAEGVLPKIRIGLLEHCQSVSFSGAAGVTVQTLGADRVVGWAAPEEVWQVRFEGGRARVLEAGGAAGQSLSEGVRLLPPEEGVVKLYGVEGHWDGVTDREYRGAIEVRVRGGALTAINVLDVETYLRGVVPSEMPAEYPLAALQAQAVSARGQALVKAGRHGRDGFDLCATQHCQVYGGATSEDERSDEAAATTWGEVLTYEGRVADTLYSSTCGGHTANNEDYWPEQRAVPYLRGGPDFDESDGVGYEFPLRGEELGEYLKYAPRVNCNQPRYGKASKLRWWVVAPRAQLEESLRKEVGEFGELLEVRVTERAESGLVRELAVIGSRKLHRLRGGASIRRGLGGLNSCSLAVEAIGEEGAAPTAFVIWGAGWGHQVGMCQVGAAGLAEKGWDYRRILSKYYPGCRVERRY